MTRARSPPLYFVLYIAHAILEVVLGVIKLRGRYADMPMPDGAAKFARHHGVCLIALALLGGECARRRLINTPTGALCSLVLCVFHAGAVLVMVYDLHLKVLVLHTPFAIGFFWHAVTTPQQLGERTSCP